MDLNSVLNEVVSWPVERPNLTDEEKAELARRVAEDDAAPDDVVAWEDVKAAALKRCVSGLS